MDHSFADLYVIGACPETATQRLREIGEDSVADLLKQQLFYREAPPAGFSWSQRMSRAAPA